MSFRFDNTLLEDYAGCEAAGIARHVHGLRSKGEKVAADIGNVYHDGLKEHFGGQGKRRVLEVFTEAYDRVVPPGEQPEEDRFARVNCIKIMERYVDTRPVEKFPWVPVELETVRGLPLDENGDWMFYVKRDMLVQDKVSGQFAPVDHKTTGRITDWFARRYRLTSQQTGYTWFTGVEKGQEVTLSYINALEIGKLPDSQRKCPVHKVLYLECGVEHANFQLFQYTRTPVQIEKWKQDALVLAKKAELMARAFGDLTVLPYAWRNGAFNGSCMFCEYKDWCLHGFEPGLAEEYCVRERWEPWAGVEQQTTTS